MRNTCVTYIVALAGMLILQLSPVQAAKADDPVFTASEIAEGTKSITVLMANLIRRMRIFH